jgi:hypothetical protein
MSGFNNKTEKSLKWKSGVTVELVKLPLTAQNTALQGMLETRR